MLSFKLTYTAIEDSSVASGKVMYLIQEPALMTTALHGEITISLFYYSVVTPVYSTSYKYKN